ncbi:MAG: acyltransferase [Candidatus Odinarchaeota archaeon]
MDNFRQRIKNVLSIKKNLKILAEYKSVPVINASSKTRFTKRTYLGRNCKFNGIEIIGTGKVIIGDNFHSGEDILIMSSIHNYDNGATIPYDRKLISKDIIIEDNVWVGARVIILGGVKIGEGAIILDGSVVAKDIPKYAIARGHPAEVFKYRDIDHYEKLKKEKKFF